MRVISFWLFFRRADLIIGRGVFVSRFKGKRKFGAKLTLYNNVIFEIHDDNSILEIGDNCVLSYGAVIVCAHSINLGDNVWIGEYTSIRDSTHDFSIQKLMGNTPDKSLPIIIGTNVWIGRGCTILPGTVIGDNVIIGANSVVKGILKNNSLYAGCPAILKKNLC